MKELKSDDLQNWTKGGNVGDKIYFVIIKSPNCPKCECLNNNIEKAFGDYKEYIGWFTYKPGPDTQVVAKIFSNLNIMSAPSIIYRYQDDEWKLGSIPFDNNDSEYIDLRCIIDAISENDSRYFGFDEYDDPIDSDAQLNMNRLLHLIHGEVDQEKLKERRQFKNKLTI